MQPNVNWNLIEYATVEEVTFLVLNIEPSLYKDNILISSPELKPDGFDITMRSIKFSVAKGVIQADIVKLIDTSNSDPNTNYHHINIIDWQNTYIYMDSFRIWLAGRDLVSGFIRPDSHWQQEYLIEGMPYYAPKLAAAVSAWKAVSSNPALLIGKTPKTALQIWLRENAAAFDLLKEDGTPNETGIEEVCKVANWKPGGGVTATPTREELALLAALKPTAERTASLEQLRLQLMDVARKHREERDSFNYELCNDCPRQGRFG